MKDRLLHVAWGLFDFKGLRTHIQPSQTVKPAWLKA